jgi:hypothetical protein
LTAHHVQGEALSSASAGSLAEVGSPRRILNQGGQGGGERGGVVARHDDHAGLLTRGSYLGHA